MNAEEFARLKHDIESGQMEVDRAFRRLDDYVSRHNGKTELGSSAESSGREVEERYVLLERLMEAMSRLNTSYKIYVKMLEKRIGF